MLIATSFEPQVTRTIFRRLFEDTKITTTFPKRHICITIEINTLFAIFRNKELRNCKVRRNHTILKEMDAVLWKVFSRLNAMKLVTQNYHKKVTFSRNIYS